MMAANHPGHTSNISNDSGQTAPSRAHGTVLVTGANGLVGQSLCRTLAARGFAVQAAVRQPQAFLPIAGVSAVQAPDLANPQARWLLDQVDVVIHAAARVHVMNPALDELERFLAVNRDGTVRLAHACAQAGVKRLVFLSTIKVNGEFTEPGHPFVATDRVAPTDPYALSKFEAEQGLQSLAGQTGLQVTIVRPPLVYGPGAKGNLELLERAVRKGVPLPIGALDLNRRSLVSLSNLVDLVRVCATHPNAAGKVFLVSDGVDLSTLGLAREIAKACAVPLKSVRVPVSLLGLAARMLGKQEMMRRLTENLQVDIRLTRQTLGWMPPQTVEQGMARAFAAGSGNVSGQ